MENPEDGSWGQTQSWQGREDAAVALCWPSERVWGGRGHVRLWGCVGSLLSGDNEGGNCPEPSCHGRGYLGDRRGWDRATEGVMGWGKHRDCAQRAPYMWWGALGWMEPGAGQDGSGGWGWGQAG